MRDPKLVSIIMPTYNRAVFTAEAISSALDQTYADFELVVIDDGSTDDTERVVRAFKDSRMRTIRSEKCEGNYFARNRGIASAQGSYLAFMDADDLWLNHKLARQMAVFEAEPEIGVCFTNHYVFVDRNRQELFHDQINTYSGDGSHYGHFMRRLFQNNFVSTSSVVARRQYFDELGAFDTTFQRAMDYDMWLRLALNARPRYIREKLVLVRVHGANISQDKITSLNAVDYLLGKALAEKGKHRFFLPEFEPVIRSQKESIRYYLGLEYLERRDFVNAKAHLSISRARGKGLFRAVALLASEPQASWLLRLIRWYRGNRQSGALRPVKSGFQASALAPSNPTTGISVVIATMNRPKDLERALESIAQQTYLPREVVIVDQSTDEQTKRVTEAFEKALLHRSVRVRYVHSEIKSLVKARNRGLSMTSGELVSFLDDDIELFEDYYERVARYFEEDPKLGGLSGNTLLAKPFTGLKWKIRKCLMALFLISDWRGGMTASGFGYPVYDCEIERQIDVQMLPGCNMTFRRLCMEGELFDEWFAGYGYREDVDYSYRIFLKSKLIMVPDAKLYHHYSTVNRLDDTTLKKMEIENYRYVFRKYKRKSLFSQVLFLYSFFGLLVLDFVASAVNLDRRKFHKFWVGILASLKLLRNSPGRVREK